MMTDSRHVKILKISQAHLNPGMNSIKLKEILARYQNGISPLNLDSLSDDDLDRIMAEIKRVILFGDITRPTHRLID